MHGGGRLWLRGQRILGQIPERERLPSHASSTCLKPRVINIMPAFVGFCGESIKEGTVF